ncbi:hypothetical protein CO058_03375 [candidate division WWE3 bacterium CG_4_9_14_0_2_um_filter_35_11]|uniref:Membrane insertase YidC/Oxa/ALB C-terminal domain-containing protein n=1 Tax=candidate division WWE3 bacterium CG_4_9_14_0_2_um_filter_35_11 TaxID=1975077 RepID=A0A2M8EL42_UNCKA|nr:MAG: hypothetical protein COV25_00770 [candidate division WWE3 bacterium CG10_big_fil_rev_8_21_14_0_10_35_32]PJC23448.1 MAG: hypothetical protein CO058_03375 [candidate division WWE3 bacterium CG_4_9_14_0_2_um_filter_35_11]
MNILTEAWNLFLYVPLLNLLIAFYHIFFNNLGFAIIAITVVIKILTYPLTKPSIIAAQKQKELQPQIAKLKLQYKNKQEFAQKQMELFKQNGINPVSGCLPQIIQFIVIIALYRAFTHILSANGVSISELNSLLYNFDYLKFANDAVLNTNFLYLNLAKADPLYIVPALSAASQFLLSKYMMQSSKKIEKVVKDTPDKKDDFMYNMQEQMMYMMPIMTLVIGISLPSGLVLYWFVSTLLAVFQYMILNKNKNGSK